MFAKGKVSLVAVALVAGALCGTAIANDDRSATASPGVSASIATTCIGNYRSISTSSSSLLAGISDIIDPCSTNAKRRCPPRCHPGYAAVANVELASLHEGYYLR